MTLQFSIHYRAIFGQSVYVSIRFFTNEGRMLEHAVALHTDDGDRWIGETQGVVGHHRLRFMTYSYQLRDGKGKVCRKEWDAVPRCCILTAGRWYYFQDIWRDLSVVRYLFPKSDRPRYPLRDIPSFCRSVIFRVSAPHVDDNHSVAILGSDPVLGDWNEAHYLLLHYIGDGDWALSINAQALKLPFSFKYVVVDNETRDVVEWESGWNRELDVDEIKNGMQLVIYGGNVRTKALLTYSDELLGEQHSIEHEISDLYI